MGNGNFCSGPINRNGTIYEKKLGKSIINTLLGKLEILERKEILINLSYPDKNFLVSKRILNTELVEDIIHDHYSKNTDNLIATLNGYKISKELSLKDNLVQKNDYILICKAFHIYISIVDGNDFLIEISLYQIFFDVFQNFCEYICPNQYKNKLSEAYYNDRLIQPFDCICNLGISEYDKIFIILGKDNNTKSPYNTSLELIKRINYRYFNNKNKINVNDYKFELNNQNLDNIELRNIGIIHFRNLKILVLNECKIQNLDFLNSDAFSNLIEVNLQKNKISYFVDIILNKLEKFDLSYNNLRKNMVKSEINIKSDFSTERLSVLLSLVFPKLKILNLSHNKIEKIDLLTQIKAKELKELNLSYNEIKNINSLDNVSFGNLKKINLSYNKIEDLDVLDQLSFCNNIEDINLMDNEIVNINILRDVRLPNLKILNILNNDINDYSVLRLIFFPKLEILFAFPNQINPDYYDKNSEIYINFKNSCNHIISKNIEVKYKI